jgi:hypothetical protein
VFLTRSEILDQNFRFISSASLILEVFFFFEITHFSFSFRSSSSLPSPLASFFSFFSCLPPRDREREAERAGENLRETRGGLATVGGGRRQRRRRPVGHGPTPVKPTDVFFRRFLATQTWTNSFFGK